MSITKKLITSDFKTQTVKSFISEVRNVPHYMGFSKHVPYGVSFEYNKDTEGYFFSAKTSVVDNKILIPNNVFNNGDKVRYYSNFTSIVGLVNETDYFVVGRDNLGFQLSNTVDGPPISILPKAQEELHSIRFSSGKAISATTGDDIESPVDSYTYIKTQTYDDLIFSKRINSDDVIPVVKKNLWESGEVYDMYDPGDPNLKDKRFFVVVDEISEYNVFKCIFNSKGAPSTSAPSKLGNETDDSIFITADGYIWKFLYSISKEDFEKFSTTNFIPVISDVSNFVGKPGSVEVAVVNSVGNGYKNHTSGVFRSSDIRYAGSDVSYGISDNSSDIVGYYENCVIKIVSSSSNGVANQYRKIVSYNPSGSQKFVVLESPFTITPSVGDTYEISPLVEIWGDGSETEVAIGRAIIEDERVASVEMLSTGRDYRNAVAKIRSPVSVSSSEIFREAKISPIVSPKNGHGSNLLSELFCDSACISVKVEREANIPDENDYRSISIIKNPKFSNVRIFVSQNSRFSTGERFITAKRQRLFGRAEVFSGSNLVGRADAGKLSANLTFALNELSSPLRGSGYDHRNNPNLIFDNTGTGGKNAAGAFVANTSFVKSSSFRANNAANGTSISNLAGHTFEIGDKVRYSVNVAGETPIFGLIDGAYYFVSNTTANTVTLTTSPGGAPIQVTNSRDFVYNVSSNTSVITGLDSTGNSLNYVSGSVEVLKNSVVLSNGTQYTQTNNSTITLSANAVANDVITVRALSNSSSNSTLGVVNGSIISATLTNRGSGYVFPPRVEVNTSTFGSGAVLEAELENTEITEYTQSINVGDYVLIEDGTLRFISKVSKIIDDFSFELENRCNITSTSASISVLKVESSGIITSSTTGVLNLRSVEGIVRSDVYVLGLSSMQYSKVLNSGIFLNSKNTNFDSVLNVTSLIGNYTSDSKFTEDERIYQPDDNIYSMPSGRIMTSISNEGSGNDVLYVSRSYGIFSREPGDRTVFGDESDASFDILNEIEGDFDLDTGEVLYIENIDPISRSANRSERIKITMEFGN